MTQLEAMALTFIVEAMVAAIAARLLSVPPARAALAAIAGTTVTHPLLWQLYPHTEPLFGALNIPVLETVIMLAESITYRLIATKRWDDALLLSLFANAGSWGIGELIYALR